MPAGADLAFGGEIAVVAGAALDGLGTAATSVDESVRASMKAVQFG